MLELVERAAEQLDDPVHGRRRRHRARGRARAAARRRGQGRGQPRRLRRPRRSSTALADEFGSQAVVCAIDARGRRGRHPRRAATRAAATPSSGRREAVERGAGELLLTSIDADGTRAGYDLELTRAVADAVEVPVIASGGAGEARTSRRGVRGGRRGGADRVDRPRAARAAAGAEGRAEGGGMERPDLTPRDRPGRRDRPRADARLDGRRGAAAHARDAARRGSGAARAQELWHKGATSGNTLAVEELRDDCDGDAMLLRVRPAGPACHTGAESCFAPWLWRADQGAAAERPAGSYVVSLLDDPAAGRAQGG